jgi:hypothetical protein
MAGRLPESGGAAEAPEAEADVLGSMKSTSAGKRRKGSARGPQSRKHKGFLVNSDSDKTRQREY